MSVDELLKVTHLKCMGRPLKDPTHVLARLRAQLSTKRHYVTRTELSKMTKIPEPTLKDIETGRFTLTPHTAIRIAYACKADVRSLVNGDDPLLDVFGDRLSADSTWIRHDPKPRTSLRRLQRSFEAAWDSAREKSCSELLAYSFEVWLMDTTKALELKSRLVERLTDEELAAS